MGSERLSDVRGAPSLETTKTSTYVGSRVLTRTRYYPQVIDKRLIYLLKIRKRGIKESVETYNDL